MAVGIDMNHFAIVQQNKYALCGAMSLSCLLIFVLAQSAIAAAVASLEVPTGVKLKLTLVEFENLAMRAEKVLAPDVVASVTTTAIITDGARPSGILLLIIAACWALVVWQFFWHSKSEVRHAT